MPYHPMSPSELDAFLRRTPAPTAKLATVLADGSPHVAPIWYAVDGDGSILFNTGRDSVKGKAILRDPRVALCVDDETPPFAFALLRGEVEVSEDLPEVRRWAGIIGGRYMGADRAEEFGARNGVPGELLLRLRPTKVTSAADLAD